MLKVNAKTAVENVVKKHATKRNKNVEGLYAFLDNRITAASVAGGKTLKVVDEIKWPQEVLNALRHNGFKVKRQDPLLSYGYLISW